MRCACGAARRACREKTCTRRYYTDLEPSIQSGTGSAPQSQGPALICPTDALEKLVPSPRIEAAGYDLQDRDEAARKPHPEALHPVDARGGGGGVCRHWFFFVL